MADVIYKVGPDENNLTALDPQPALPEGIRWPELIFAGDGSAAFNGYAFAELVWSGSLDDDDRNALLTQLGLGVTLASGPTASAQKTYQLRDNNDTAVIVTAWASLPERTQRRMGFYDDFVILLNRIEVVP